MIVFKTLEPYLDGPKPYILTIGNFDGVHLGHQTILKTLRQKAGEGTIGVVTFSNHPSHVLANREPVPQIFFPELKFEFLKQFGVNVVYLLEFTKELASQNYDIFLKNLKSAFPFDMLILGEGATLGKKREGTPEKIKAVGDSLAFSTIYLAKQTAQDKEISSGTIRILIQQGVIKEASSLLGHPYILEGSISSSGELTLPSGLCLPPDGKYPIVLDEIQTILTIENQICTLALPSPLPREKVRLTFI